MFTGITRGVFPVASAQKKGTLLTYAVTLPAEMIEGLQIGASVSIDGVCQTVVRVDGNDVVFEAIEETLKLTTLGALSQGDLVTAERSFRVGDEIGGHEVSGHVIGKGRIHDIKEDDGSYDLRVAVPATWMKYIQRKGFIAIDGSSLTVGQTEICDDEGLFWLHLIPETLRLTKLGKKAVGDYVNIELDARTVTIVDTVERVLAERLST